MKSNTVLVIAPNFVPDASVGAQRTLSLVNHLSETGWTVNVVSLDEKAFGGLLDQGQLAKLDNRVRVHRFADVDIFKKLLWRKKTQVQEVAVQKKTRDSMPENYAEVSSRAIRWFWPLYMPDKKLQWSLAIAIDRIVRQLVRSSDCIYSSGPPQSVHVAGVLLKRFYRVPWVADLRDPWTDNHLRNCPNGFARRWDNHLEKAVLGRADHVIANTPYFRNLLRRRYPACEQAISSIPNGYDSSLFSSDGCLAEMNQKRLVITHLGSFYGHRDIRPLLQALKTLKQENPDVLNDLYFEFIGPGTGKFAGLVAEYGLDQQVFLGLPVSYEEAVKKDRSASVLLCLPLTPEDMYSQVPAKIYQFIALGKPVLAFAAHDGAMAMVLEEAGVDYCIADPRDPVDIGQTLVALHWRWKQGLLRYGGYEEARRRFDRQFMAVRIEQLLSALVKKGARG